MKGVEDGDWCFEGDIPLNLKTRGEIMSSGPSSKSWEMRIWNYIIQLWNKVPDKYLYLVFVLLFVFFFILAQLIVWLLS